MTSFDELEQRRIRPAEGRNRGNRGLDVWDLDASARRDREAAALERRQATSDRRRAAEYLAATYRDETTGALSRRPGWERLLLEVQRAHRTSLGLALAFVDVDGLKGVNDRYGHRRGDELLAAVGLALRSSLRPYDVIVRYGGDEFICALPGSTSAAARTSLDRAGRRLAALMAGAAVSVGHAELAPGDTLDDLVRRADADLYRQRSQLRQGERWPARSNVAEFRHHERQCCERRPPSVPCGACGGDIPVRDFRVVDVRPMTRQASCARCGRRTLIRLE